MKTIVLALAWLAPAIGHADPAHHRGLTLEASIGAGVVVGGIASDQPSHDVALGGVNLGVGGWLSSRLALTFRVTANTTAAQPPHPSGVPASDAVRRTFVFVGPSVQYWLGEQLWLGGGVGLAEMVSELGGPRGVGLDLRLGYAFLRRSTRTIHLSFEVTPSYYPTGGPITFTGTSIMRSSSTGAGVSLLLGYQFL